MNSQDIDTLLVALRDAETCCRGSAEASAELERKYEAANQYLFWNWDFLSQRNAFRVANARAMRIRRPRVLMGRYRVDTLNYQTLPLLRNADVMFLSLYGDRPARRDAVVADIRRCDFAHLLSALPYGYAPDLYFDYQVCASETFIRGIEDAPFPTVASLCHMFRTLKIERIAGMFDFVLPVSRRFGELLAATVPREKIVDLPFGLSWGSFDHVIADPGENAPRDIDVLLSFDAAGVAYGPYRERTIELFERAKSRLGGRYSFVRATGLKKSEYVALLARSKIVLNVVGINGPYNYRTCEAINAGALLMQYDARYATGPQYIEEYFSPDGEIVLFDETDFLPKLKALLADPMRIRRIARSGSARLRSQYSYDALYRRLFEVLRTADAAGLVSRRIKKRDAAKNRLLALLQCEGIPYFVASDADLADLLAATDGEPCALLLPLYAGLSPEHRRLLRAAVSVAPDAGDDDAAADLAFYDAAFSAIAAPSFVDRFNHLLLCAGAGRPDAAGMRQLAESLQAPTLRLDDAEIVRISRKGPPLADAVAMLKADRIVLNLGCLLAAGDAGARSDAARDYMAIRLYGILAAAAPDGDVWRHAAAAVFARHPIADTTATHADVIPLAS
jgi:hypothetical protein